MAHSAIPQAGNECHDTLGLSILAHWSPDGEEARKAFEENEDVAAKLGEMGKLVVEIRNLLRPILLNGSPVNFRASQRDSSSSSSKGHTWRVPEKEHGRDSLLRNEYSS